MDSFSVSDIPENLSALRRFLRERFEELGSDSPDMETRIILEKRLGLSWSQILSGDRGDVDQKVLKQIHADLKERTKGKPLSRIYSENEFWGLPFKLGAATLDPRQDSETIIDIALKRFDKNAEIKILDMGTGSGCLLIALLHEFKNARGIGSDISPDALAIAKENGVLNGVHARVKWIESDWDENISETFDLIISNPPYIRSAVIPELDENVRNFDPILALDGGDDGLQAYKKIISSIYPFLNKGGIVLFEIGFDQAEDVMRLGKESRFSVKDVHADLSGQPRVVEMSCGDK